jgi:hypothetical protein
MQLHASISRYFKPDESVRLRIESNPYRPTVKPKVQKEFALLNNVSNHIRCFMLVLVDESGFYKPNYPYFLNHGNHPSSLKNV